MITYYRKKSEGVPSIVDALQPGRNCVAAGLVATKNKYFLKMHVLFILTMNSFDLDMLCMAVPQ